MVKIFVNYRRDDAGASAARIRDRLASAFGAANVFMDVDDLQPGQRFDHELAKALSACNVFLTVIGSRWYDLMYARAQVGGRDYVREEITTAFARGITVIPVLIDRAALPRPDALPDDLRPLVFHQAYQIRHEHFGRDMDALLATLAKGRKISRDGGLRIAVQTSMVRRIVATVGYSVLALVVLAYLGILSGQQPSIVEAVFAIGVLAAGVAAFIFGGQRWRWLRVIGTLIGASMLAGWITPVVNQEVTIYNAFCEPIDYEFWECEMKGGHLTPTDADRFRVDRSSQTVYRFGGDLGTTYLFKKCTVADRLNWSCHYNDDSAVVEVTEGKYRTIALNEKDRELFKTLKTHTARGQVSFPYWALLHFAYRASTPSSRPTAYKQTGSSTERTGPLPTAAEIFRLRSECASLGEKVLDGNVIGRALTQSQVSHYDPQTKHCHVELTVQTADTTKDLDYLNRVLFDGQTNEMLAIARLQRGQKWGMVYDKQHQTTTLGNAGWDDASAYIDKMMAEDRKR